MGQSQVLFQAGLHVPGESARMSPVDGMYTHFATLERTDSGMGRLAEEARRLNDIFQRVTDKSLVLLNESLSSTSPGESLYLARDIVHALKLFSVRAIFATHLHELAENLDSTNAAVTGDSRVVSLVAGVTLNGDEAEASEESAVSTFEIKKAPPRGLSYAKGIAIRHGISFEQLKDHWLERQVRRQEEIGIYVDSDLTPAQDDRSAGVRKIGFAPHQSDFSGISLINASRLASGSRKKAIHNSWSGIFATNSGPWSNFTPRSNRVW